MSLSPWDLGSVFSFEFTVYQPRRNSYLQATKGRKRPGSYRRAIRSQRISSGDAENSSQSGSGNFDASENDYINNVLQNKHRESWRHVVDDDVEPAVENDQHENVFYDEENHKQTDGSAPVNTNNSSFRSSIHRHNQSSIHYHTRPHKHNITIALNDEPIDRIKTLCSSPTCQNKVQNGQMVCQVCSSSTTTYKRNMIILCLSFILVFTSFRATQNVQSSLNGRVGTLSLALVYITMFSTCLFSPEIVRRFGAKRCLVIGFLGNLVWLGSNAIPPPSWYLFLPGAIIVGFSLSLAWNAQVIYLAKLSKDFYEVKEDAGNEIFQYNSVFLACFQTTHIWGNLVSSLTLTFGNLNSLPNSNLTSNQTSAQFKVPAQNSFLDLGSCGKFDCSNKFDVNSEGLFSTRSLLFLAELCIALLGFILVIFFLERINAKGDCERTLTQTLQTNWRQMKTDITFWSLIPLLFFNGYEQGFVYADFNKTYIACTLGPEFIGWAMMTLGLANAGGSLTVGVLGNRLPRQAIVGMAGLLHVGLVIFMLIWAPEGRHHVVLLAVSALWGLCDSVWQTQCNILIGIGCSSDSETAFVNFRVLQSAGAALAFLLSGLACPQASIYALLVLLVMAVVSYASTERRIKASISAINRRVQLEMDESNVVFVGTQDICQHHNHGNNDSTHGANSDNNVVVT